MTTPALTKESEARLETWARHLTPDYLDFLRETLVIAEAAAVARHVRETGCDGLTVERLRHALVQASIDIANASERIAAALASPATEEVE